MNPTNRKTSSAFDCCNGGWVNKAEQVALCGKHVAVIGLGGLCALALACLCASEKIMGGDNGRR
ncbi:MAG: hypothetical protein WB870_04535 [Gallionellaceae bacterium]